MNKQRAQAMPTKLSNQTENLRSRNEIQALSDPDLDRLGFGVKNMRNIYNFLLKSSSPRWLAFKEL